MRDAKKKSKTTHRGAEIEKGLRGETKITLGLR